MVVREAVATDARRLAGMRWDVKAEDGGLDPETREAWVDRHTTWFKDAVTGDWQVFVAEDGLRLCGHVFVRVVDKAPSPQPGATAIGYVTNFYVVPDRRGAGIGDRLLDAMTPGRAARRSTRSSCGRPTSPSRTTSGSASAAARCCSSRSRAPPSDRL